MQVGIDTCGLGQTRAGWVDEEVSERRNFDSTNLSRSAVLTRHRGIAAIGVSGRRRVLLVLHRLLLVVIHLVTRDKDGCPFKMAALTLPHRGVEVRHYVRLAGC